MRITEEGYHVEETEFVYEIMYRYYNEETSLPEPEGKLVRDVPVGWKIWKHRRECWLACKERIRKEKFDNYAAIYLSGGSVDGSKMEEEGMHSGEEE